ncbi:Tyrosine-protein phosphatase [Lachnellula occidentalis]|uniref:protein-tyrosine-phosphatase n=1 Tax=Lachnellula occidentalis TaxID=215460 RepID=A0A8H8RRM8_9HELO|nr:Tyrosine-protein phosphatase [Lachnellula occidentalis]
MVTKTTTRPTPRSSQSHAHSHTHPHRTSSKSSTTPKSPTSRVPHSVGQPLPPPPSLRSPGAQVEARTPSPNYFGLVVDPTTNPRDSAVGPKDNWSPPTSSIASFGGASPKRISLETHPDFELFRRRTEEGNAFNLGHGNLSHFAATPGDHMRPRLDRKHTRPDTEQSLSPIARSVGRNTIPESMDLDRGHSPIPTPSQDPKRHPELSSLGGPSFFDIPPMESPANISTPPPPTQRTALSTLDDRHPRLSLPLNRLDPPSPHVKLQQRGEHQRAETLPSSLEEGPAMIPPAKLRDILERLPSSQFLLLDLRVFPQFSVSRVKGALNLCIPTTLLKRPSFTLQKLQETFANDGEKARFATWRSAQHIVVYDAYSTDKKDAFSAVNTLKKFANEGWKGSSYILRGGFAEFATTFPQLIDNQSTQALQPSKINLSLGTSAPGVAPVAGGCAMPATNQPANPFFSNIRQNQDLIGGVGQMDVMLPKDLNEDTQRSLPTWLFKAAAQEDHGKRVADKFLNLELAEQSRMKKALSSDVSYGTPATDSKTIQIAGIEKGGKNRYNNIWPFEHARVRLQGRPTGACDYVNASHVKASRSNKRYIASQGPLPTTFGDFWSVIWDYDVRVIVMLTAEKEGGQLKCDPYWSSRDYGQLKLTKLSEKKISLDLGNHQHHRPSRDGKESGRKRATTTIESAPRPQSPEQPHAIIRKFTLSHSARPFSPMREITQVHYSSWPDFGAPADPNHILSLVELSNSMQRSSFSPSQTTRSDEPELNLSPRPVLVHCSAGCGRTGTFCTVDSVIDMLKRQRKETKSGIEPMEITPASNDGDYMGKGRNDAIDGDWIFDPNLDLIEKTVEDLRGQRLSMVQSLRQYVLCYETVLEWVTQQNIGTTRSGRDRSGSHGSA